MTKLSYLVPITLLAGCGIPSDAQTILGERAIVFEANSGEMVDAFEGSLVVPENRSVEGSRSLTLKYPYPTI